MSTKAKEAVKKMEKAEVYMNKKVDTDIDSQLQNARENELQNWSKQTAQQIAQEYDLLLTSEHFEVIRFLQDYYIENGLPQNARVFEDLLDERYADKGGKKYLHKLFPEGPVTQGCEIAGIPEPAHAEDTSFGTAR